MNSLTYFKKSSRQKFKYGWSNNFSLYSTWTSYTQNYIKQLPPPHTNNIDIFFNPGYRQFSLHQRSFGYPLFVRTISSLCALNNYRNVSGGFSHVFFGENCVTTTTSTHPLSELLELEIPWFHSVTGKETLFSSKIVDITCPLSLDPSIQRE
jgi:hypothetical protein